jgi:broad specificity phosphatase PhoE
VFQACTTHWLNLNPPPDAKDWSGIADPVQRLRAALERLYDYYKGTRRMWLVSHRDVADVPALREPMAQFAEYVSGVGEGLAVGMPGDRKSTLVTIKHAITFPTWQSLDDLGLPNASKVDLVLRWVGDSR